jgi:hypothetical protein
MSFEPSRARRGLDVLLAVAPHLDLIDATIPGEPDVESWRPWLRVDLGQPSEGRIEAYAVQSYAIWRETGAVHRMRGDGAVDDDPFIEPAPVDSYNAVVRAQLREAMRLLAIARDEWIEQRVAYPTHHWLDSLSELVDAVPAEAVS